MSNIQDKAKEYLSYSLSVIPTKEDKRPALPSWKPYQTTRLTSPELKGLFSKPNVKGLAVICGAISGGLEVIDVDTKHDTTGILWRDLSSLIQDNLSELYSRLVIAQTKSGGYHIYYRCDRIEGNLKLATKQNREVLIETRGEGGYVIAPPTPQYTYLQGEPGNIPTISPEERGALLSICRSFNEIPEEKPKVKTTSSTTYTYSGLSPFEDYNQRGDIIALLENNGWKIVNQIGPRINLLRPGSTDSKTSGNFHTELRVLRVFSSSTQFNPDKGYSPSSVFALLDCNGDNKEAYRRLLELGYGERPNKERTASTEIIMEEIMVEIVNKAKEESYVIFTPGEELKAKEISKTPGEEIVIRSPGKAATEEVLRALDVLADTGKTVFVEEEGREVRDYTYQLNAIFQKYGAIQDRAGGLTDRLIGDLLKEIVITSTKLQPLDRDRFVELLLSKQAIKELGITEESLQATVEELRYKKDKELQRKKLNKLQQEVKTLNDKGEPGKAIEAIRNQLKEIEVVRGRDLLPPARSFDSILGEIAATAPAFKTGYSSLDKFVGFTPGAITLIAGRPSHGKTTLMFNFLLEMSQAYQRKSFYFFTYEEPDKNIYLKLLNRLTATDLSDHFRSCRDLARHTNYEFLKTYIKQGRSDIAEVETGKQKLRELTDTGRIRVIGESYSVEQLHSLISYLKKDDKNVGAVFIDYIQRMNTERRTQDKRTEIAHISDKILQTAKETDLPIILGAQFSRAAATTNEKRPVLENLKEAGNLEEDANTVLSVHNAARENGETGQKEVELEIKALKNREGEVNRSTYLSFDTYTGVIKEEQTKSPF